MPQAEMTPIIATRQFTWIRYDDAEVEAFVEIGAPVQLPVHIDEDGDWYCTVRTRGMGDDTVRTVIGVDSVQALYHALALAGKLVGSSFLAVTQDLDWLEVPNFGFPPLPTVPDNGADIPPPEPTPMPSP